MHKKKKNTYLSELFLENLDGDFSRQAVLMALEKCNDDMLKRRGIYPYTRNQNGYFFNKGKQTRQIEQELLDFWDVYGEFDHMFRPNVKRNYLILQMV